MWMRREAAVISEAASKGAACRKGCSACCHIDVEVTEAEAKLIGAEIGRAPSNEPAGAIQVPRTVNPDALLAVKQQGSSTYRGIPCTFLDGGICSIWESRPLACRWQFNVDRDALLCRLVEAEAISVPYLDTTLEKAYMIAKVGLGGRMADIRAWFPAVHGECAKSITSGPGD